MEGKELPKDNEFNEIERYRKVLVGQTVRGIGFSANADEGLTLLFESGAVLSFCFSGNEGTIFVSERDTEEGSV